MPPHHTKTHVNHFLLKGAVQEKMSDMVIVLLAILIALICGMILIFLSGANPIIAYQGLFSGMIGSKRNLIETCVASTPYILTGLSVAIGFQCGLFNIGAEGQFYMGALCSVIVGCADFGLPSFIHLPLSLLAGMAGGAFWGMIPGLLKVKFGGHEVINTIMMNYIGINLVDYLVKSHIRAPDATVDRSNFILKSAQLPKLFGDDYRLHGGFLIALSAVFLVWWLLYKSTVGFEIRTCGSNQSAAFHSGICVKRNIVLTMAFAGGLAGLAGAGEVLGLKHNLPASFSVGYGYDAIAVAFLAKSNALFVLPAAFLWGGLRNGASLMQIRSGISIDLINVIQALVIVFIAADPIIRKVFGIGIKNKASAVFSKGWGK